MSQWFCSGKGTHCSHVPGCGESRWWGRAVVRVAIRGRNRSSFIVVVGEVIVIVVLLVGERLSSAFDADTNVAMDMVVACLSSLCVADIWM
jgi:hypothetical protein